MHTHPNPYQHLFKLGKAICNTSKTQTCCLERFQLYWGNSVLCTPHGVFTQLGFLMAGCSRPPHLGDLER